MTSANAPDITLVNKMNRIALNNIATHEQIEKTEPMAEMYSDLFSRIRGIQSSSALAKAETRDFMQLLKDCAANHKDPDMTPGHLLARAIAELKANRPNTKNDHSNFAKQTVMPLFSSCH